MEERSKNLTREVFQLINHRIRTPLSVIVHELEYLLQQEQVECSLALKQAMHISRLLGDFTNLLGSQESPTSSEITTLFQSAKKEFPSVTFNLNEGWTHSVRARQLSNVFVEILGLLTGARKIVSDASLIVEKNAISIVGKLIKPQYQNKDVVHYSLTKMANTLLPAANPITAIIDAVLADNNLAIKSRSVDGELMIEIYPANAGDRGGARWKELPQTS